VHVSSCVWGRGLWEGVTPGLLAVESLTSAVYAQMVKLRRRVREAEDEVQALQAEHAELMNRKALKVRVTVSVRVCVRRAVRACGDGVAP
jgi:hypothetical protein